MRTLLEALNLATKYLDSKRVVQPRLNAEILFSHALKCSRLELYLKFDHVLNQAILEQLRIYLKRRAMHEPWQYIVGEIDFGAIKLNVDNRVLIPRPETEELVSAVIEHYKACPPYSFIDLGTGSGAIALSLLHAWPDTRALAVDMSLQALELAQHNADYCDLSPRVTFFQSDWLESISERDFELIVANPPYLTQDEWACAEKQVRLFEPTSALIASNDGITDLLNIINTAFEYLCPEGWLILETGILQHHTLLQAAQARGYADTQSHKDLSGRDRFLWLKR